MLRRIALLVDVGFVLKRLRPRLGRSALAEDVMAECRRVLSDPRLAGRELLRIYMYDAPPATGVVVNPVDQSRTNLMQTEVYLERRSLHDRLELQSDVAFRKGELAIRGWKVRPRAIDDVGRTGRALRAEDVEPVLEQKGVDLRIGLDIARISLRGLADTIVVMTGDSDFVPAFKFARREGVRVYLDHLGASVRRELEAHVDVVL
ncbi:MAG: NYN domain-containing protein [Planctomycetota bacterium]|nr:NYN domain-containing protein [Planctomycetota bacterium]